MDIAYLVSNNGDSLEKGAWPSCQALFFAHGEPSRGFESCRPSALFCSPSPSCRLLRFYASTLLRFYASTDFHTLPQNFILSRTFSCLRLWPALPCLALPWPSPCPRPCLALALRISRTFSCLWLFLPHPEGLPALKSLAKNKIKNKNQKAPSQDTHTGSTLTAPPRLVSSRLVSSRLASSQLFYYLYRTAGPRQHPL